MTDLGEQCDDGNQFSGDGCSALCEKEKPAPLPPPPPPTPPPPVIVPPTIVAKLTPPPPVYVNQPQQPQRQYRVPVATGTKTGPGAVIFLASGAAAGVGLVRRRMRKS